jgi:hypothetical protein
MGSRASKPAAEKATQKTADPLDESFAPLLGILDGIKVDGTDILNAANFAGLPAAAHALFSTIRQLVEVDVKSLPEEERGRYRVLVADYFGVLRKLSQFLDGQIAVFRVIVAETNEPVPDKNVIHRAYNIIDVKGCKDLTNDVQKLLGRVQLERNEVKGAIRERINRAVIYGALGVFALGVLIASGIGAALVAATVTVATVASIAAAGGVAAVPAFFKLRVCLSEAKGLKVIEGNLKTIQEHLKAIEGSMSDTRVSYQELEIMGVDHKRLGQCAGRCLDDLIKARNIILERN